MLNLFQRLCLIFMIITINIQEPYFSLVMSGQKTVEGRLNKGKFEDAAVGDILFVNEAQNFLVIGKRIYSTFAQMIEVEGVEKVIPGAVSITEAVDVYYKFYTPEQEKEFGVVALEIKKT